MLQTLHRNVHYSVSDKMLLLYLSSSVLLIKSIKSNKFLLMLSNAECAHILPLQANGPPVLAHL